MKKSFLLAALVSVTIFFFGCSSVETATTTNTTDIPQLYVAGEDTVVASQQFRLSPFTKEYCGDVVKGMYWNPTGFRYDTVRAQGEPVSQDSIKKWFGDTDPFAEANKKNNTSFQGMPKWFQSLFWVMLALLLVGIVIAFLIWALRSGRDSGQRSQFLATGVPGTKPEAANSSTIVDTLEYGKDDYEGILQIIAAAKKGATGAYVKMGNSVEVFVPSSIPEINISADPESKVRVDIEANTITADMVDVYEGHDYRQYNRQSGGSKEKPSDKKDDEKS